MRLTSGQKLSSMKFIDGSFLRFLIVGGLNTLITYLVYLVFLGIADYRVAFTISFTFGIFIAYFLNSLVVFKVTFCWKKLLQYPIIYLVQYLLALVLLNLEVELMSIDQVIAPLINVVLLLPVTFVLNRYILQSGRENDI